MKNIFCIITFILISFSAQADLQDIFGNSEIGDKCVSDYECYSLCCNASSGTCAPHDPKGEPAAYCSKSTGEFCVASEFCKPQVQNVCKLVRIPPEPGQDSCMIRCIPTLLASRCVNRYCEPPRVSPMPTYPLDCSTAVDP